MVNAASFERDHVVAFAAFDQLALVAEIVIMSSPN
jgi:hypothetical protein